MRTDFLDKAFGRLYRAFGPQHWWPGDTPFEVAVGAILTQNTNWTNVEKAIANLKRENMLSARALHLISPARLSGLIRPAGYFNIKAGRLKNFVALLMDEYSGSMKRMEAEGLPEIRNTLLSVNGIGPETADSIILYALRKPVFVVDAYTRRVFSRHAILDHDASYETYQALFHGALRRDEKLYNEYHALIVRLAKNFCRTRPACAGCPLEGM